MTRHEPARHGTWAGSCMGLRFYNLTRARHDTSIFWPVLARGPSWHGSCPLLPPINAAKLGLQEGRDPRHSSLGAKLGIMSRELAMMLQTATRKRGVARCEQLAGCDLWKLMLSGFLLLASHIAGLHKCVATRYYSREVRGSCVANFERWLTFDRLSACGRRECLTRTCGDGWQV